MDGKIKGDDVDEVGKILRSRFTNGERAPSEFIQAARNIGYSGLLANPVSALMNLSDILMQFHLQGVRPTLDALARMATGRKFINAKDFGLVDHLAEEFTSTHGTVNFLNKMLKTSFFTHFDILGKNVNINAAMSKLVKQTKSEAGIQAIQAKYSKFLAPGEIDQLVKDLRNGEKSDLVNQIIFTELSRSQPISRMEMPQGALDHPDGRILYQMKTFMLKQADIVRRDAIDEMRKGNVAKGLKALASLSILYGISGVAQDKLRDFVYGRTSDLKASDIPFDMLKTFGWSQYMADRAFGVGKEEAKERRKQGEPVRAQKAAPLQTLGSMAMPPWKMYEQIVTGDPAAIQYVPYAGRILYERQKSAKAKKGAH